MNWLRVFGHAEATHIAQGVCQRLHTLEGRQSNAWHPFADRGTDIDVVAACWVFLYNASHAQHDMRGVGQKTP